MENCISLQQCLELLPVRQIRALANSLNISLGSVYDRAIWIKKLRDHLLSTDYLATVLRNLDAEAFNALRMLMDSNGHTSRAAFQDQFGKIRLWRPWRGDASNVKPWLTISSPAESLFYQGLIYLFPWKTEPGVHQKVVIPLDLQRQLAELMNSTKQGATEEIVRPGSPTDLRWHMVVFLATVENEQPSLLHENWLPPALIKTLAQRIGLTGDLNGEIRRSERFIPYLAFIHWLALTTGLVSHGVSLQLTTKGWQWLAANPSHQWQTLWQGWLLGDGEAGIRYGMAWSVVPPEGRDWLVTKLTRYLQQGILPVDDVIAWLHLQDDRGWLVQPWRVENDIVGLFLTGPLWWLQFVSLLQREGHDAVRLTHMGAWLVKSAETHPSFPSSRAGYLDQQDNTLIHIPTNVHPYYLVRVSRYAEWEKSNHPGYEVRLRLSPQKIGIAAAQGVSVKQIVDVIEKLVERPASHRLQRKLHQWMKRGQRVRLQRLVALETDSAMLMGELRQRKLVRRNLGNVIGPNRSVVNPDRINELTQQLQSLGWYVNWQRKTDEQANDKGKNDIKISRAEAGFLLAAARVFQALGEMIPLHGHPPDGLLLRLSREISHDQDAAARYLTDETMKQLQMLIQGYDGLPSWYVPQQEANPLPIIKRALESKQLLDISYWAPACGQPLERRVQPYFLEERAGYYYLTGYCYLREDERIFRVDRILWANIVSD